MNNPKTAFLKPITPNLLRYFFELHKIWRSNTFSNSGTQLLSFKNEISEFLNLSNPPAICANGTVAEIALLKLLSLTSPKKEIVTTPYSFISSASSIINAGLKPVFVDIDSQLTLSSVELDAAISEQTLAVLSVDVYGIPNNQETIRSICNKYSLLHLSDKSHSFGVKNFGVSTIAHSDFSFVSMHATKVMSAIEGGLIVANSSTFPSISDIELYNNFGFSEGDACFHGFNGKMDELRAAFGRLNLRQLNKMIRLRKDVFNKYLDNGLAKYVLPRYLALHYSNSIDLNYSYLPILLSPDDRPLFLRDLNLSGINIKIYFERLIPDYLAFKANTDIWKCSSASNLDCARRLASSIVTLPIYHQLPCKVIKSICSIISRYSPYQTYF